ncbi:hypothetical protein C0992_006029 [Termitomyces sp. T32_za158]|nr:hypothetical protein C0992_006029 [Termitomyces sp. T32_za158]
MQKPCRRMFQTTTAMLQAPMAQSSSPLAPLGVRAAIQAAADPKIVPRPKIFEEFSLKDRVGIVSGGNRGLGLEMALALCELGARAIYCFDLPSEPSKEWKSTEYFVKKLGGRIEYVSADVRDQRGMWDKVKVIGDKEGRMDVCITAAGIAPKVIKKAIDYPEGPYQELLGGLDIPELDAVYAETDTEEGAVVLEVDAGASGASASWVTAPVSALQM